LAGREDYEVTKGSVSFEGRDLLAMRAEERARAGLFLGFQYPVEIPGVNNVYCSRRRSMPSARPPASRRSMRTSFWH